MNGAFSRNEEACDAACLRLLYNGTVKKVVTAYTCPQCSPPRENAPLAFWIERREHCEEFNNSYAHESPALPADRTRSMPSAPQEHAVRARIAAGECIAYGPGDRSEAMLILSLNEHFEQG